MKYLTFLFLFLITSVQAERIEDLTIVGTPKSAGDPAGALYLETDPAAAAGAAASYIKSNLTATSSPTVTDDSASNYGVNSEWVNVTADTKWICLDASVGAAVWKDITAGATGGDSWTDAVDAVITPDGDGTRDFGLTGTRFATGFLDDIDITADVVLGGTADFNLGTMTDSNFALDITGAWNDAAEAFSLIQVDITDSASLTTSLLMDFQVDSTTVFSIDKAGDLVANEIVLQSLIFTEQAAGSTLVAGEGEFFVKNDTPNTPYFRDDTNTEHEIAKQSTVDALVETDVWIIAASDEDSDLGSGTAKVKFKAPYAATITGVSASVTTAPTGASIIVDINEEGTTLMATDKIEIEVSEDTSEDATTPPALTDTAIAQWNDITIDIDQIGSTVAGTGLKIYITHTH